MEEVKVKCKEEGKEEREGVRKARGSINREKVKGNTKREKKWRRG